LLENQKEDLLFGLLCKISIHMSKVKNICCPDEHDPFLNFLVEQEADKCTDDIFVYLQETLGVERYVVKKR